MYFLANNNSSFINNPEYPENQKTMPAALTVKFCPLNFNVETEDFTFWWLHRFRSSSCSHIMDYTLPTASVSRGLRMGPVHILSSCITCQTTFSTPWTQKHLCINFRTRLEDGFSLYVWVSAWNHTSWPVRVSHTALDHSGFPNKRSKLRDRMTKMKHIVIRLSDLNANCVRWPLQLMSLLARAKKTQQQCLVAGSCRLLIPAPDFSACIPPQPPL